jgi:hypothetical protein
LWVVRACGICADLWWLILQAIAGPDHRFVLTNELNDPETNASVATFAETCEHE